MRVISGSAKSLRLITLPNDSIRPTSDRNKETLFNIIGFDIINSNFLDLFAGSGAIGIEALSRGARSATFVDSNKKAIEIIKTNLLHCNLLDSAQIFYGDFKAKLSNIDSKFDIIFIDPPFETKLETKAINEIIKNSILTDEGMIVLELPKERSIDFIYDHKLNINRIKEYKNIKHVFINKG